MNKRPIIIDTDPGIDDFFCIMLANARPEFDIRAITTIAGNSALSVVSRNALRIAHLFNMNTRVAAGSARALMFEFDIPEKSYHGPTGLGNVTLPDPPYGLDAKPAWDVIYEEAVRAQGELEIVPVGPFTNIAIALLKYPDLKGLIKRITVMGGSAAVGNVTAYAEANVWHDPHAAEVVFRSGVPVTMCGLDATFCCPLTTEQVHEMAEICRPDVRDTVKDLATYRNGEPFHDCVTVATMVDPSMAEVRDLYVSVELNQASQCFGQTLCDVTGTSRKKPNVQVILSVDSDKYTAMFRNMMNVYA